MDEKIFEHEFDGEANYDGVLAEWVMDKCNDWRDHFESNYSQKFEEYYRLFRNQWSAEDSDRESERSKLIAPALAQAVESNVAEVEEATFGRGKIFDVRDDVADQQTGDMVFLRKKLHEDFHHARVRSSVAEVLINAAVYGTGIAEITIEEQKVYAPATQPMMDGAMQAVGVNETYRPLVKLNPVQPKNFLIDPTASSVDTAMGVAIDEYVGRHIVEELQEQGSIELTPLSGRPHRMTRLSLTRRWTADPRDVYASPSTTGKYPANTLLQKEWTRTTLTNPAPSLKQWSSSLTKAKS